MLKVKVFVAALVALLLVPGVALAQNPPCVFMGMAYLDGQPASRVTVSAWIEGKNVGEVTTKSDGSYYLQVDGNHPGKTVSFKVDGNEANETATWSMGSTISQDLHASTQPSEGNSGSEATGSGIKSVNVKTLEPGAKATASFNSSTGVLTLGIPQGPKGEPGTGVEDVKAKTVKPGKSANANFDRRTGILTIDVPRGPKGDTGTSVEQVKVKTLEPGSEATADFNPDTGVLTLGIPKGKKGEKGEQGPGAPGGTALPIAAIVLAVIALIVSFVLARRPRV